MSYLWQEFNIKTFEAETLVFRDGVFCEDLSEYQSAEFNKKQNKILINKNSKLPVHIIYVGEIAGNIDLNIDINAENTNIIMDFKTISKKQTFLNVFVNFSAFFNGVYYRSEVVVCQNDVGCAFCNVRSGYAHAYAYIGGFDAGGVVNAVAGHSDDLTERSPRFDYTDFVFGAYPCVYAQFRYALNKFVVAHFGKFRARYNLRQICRYIEFARYRKRRIFVIARYHNGRDPRSFAGRHRRFDFFSRRIYHTRKP